MAFPVSPQLFAIVPAAGWSRRMGRPKLLLPLGGRTVLARLLEALDRPGVTERLVVVRPDDEALASEAVHAGATVVRPGFNPPDMRNSVECALDHIRMRNAPRPEDGWLLAPADHPVLKRGVLDLLIAEWVGGTADIMVPRCGTRRGHPTFFRWRLADDVSALPPDCGLNRLLRIHADRVTEVPVNDPAVLTDLDTPADYEALLRQAAAGALDGADPPPKLD